MRRLRAGSAGRRQKLAAAQPLNELGRTERASASERRVRSKSLEQLATQFLAVIDRPRVVGAHQLEDVHVLLSSLVV